VTCRPFTDNELNVEALPELLRTINLPHGHTGQLTVQLHFAAGVIRTASFELNHMKLGLS
jgi:hypothetical protein